ncbi:MAG: phosphoribosylamine--glycine ligase [Gammaproteobacteria bacterium]|jgi:phosphoribosylamine--glycine ligase|nr:phosphoribosylamine--glycine ligase [Gammaproteobacteria bacterium]
MNILIIGGGGREHALAWKAAQSPLADTVYVAPGNAGTALEDGVENVDIAADDIPALLSFALANEVGLTIVGPEQPLVAGVADKFIAAGLRCFGPSRRASQLEGSKAFAKDFLARHNIPTAAYAAFTDIDEARAYIHAQGVPMVVKADGLAAGKGVILAQTEAEALSAVEDMLSGNVYGEAGHRVVIEEFLQGEEASFIVMADGKNCLPLATSQDHKARDNAGQGPNTGGMGAYSPAPVVTPVIHERVMKEVIQPTLAGMREEGYSFSGFLYAGLMIAADGTPRVLEYNVRLGDPETQPVMCRLQSDLVELCQAALEGHLDTATVEWDERAALGVVMAAGGYPDEYRKGDAIDGLDSVEAGGCKVFHAGTRMQDEVIVTSGGRVLCVCALGNTITEARHKVYDCVNAIYWPDVYYRTDIGYRAMKREE